MVTNGSTSKAQRDSNTEALVGEVENRMRRQFLASKAMLDSQLEQRIKEGALLVPNSLTKLVAASN